MKTYADLCESCQFANGDCKCNSQEREYDRGYDHVIACDKYEPATCQWELEIANEGDVYHTSCGNAQIFICCNVEENNYKYCPYCGKPIKQVEPKSLFCTFDE